MNPTSEKKRSRAARAGIIALAAGALGTTMITALASGAGTTIESANVPHFAGALVNQSSHALYVLSSERGAKLKCTGSCLATWIPLEVATSTKSVSLGAGVKGMIGFVVRGKSKKQVTFNSYPLYSFVGDSGPRQSHGESLKADGGTWTLVRSKATSAAATPFSASASGTTTTTKPPTTTTTSPPPTTTTTAPGGGGGIGY
jgi:predicted lipoprotein with Yx(FWY)xxD motif